MDKSLRDQCFDLHIQICSNPDYIEYHHTSSNNLRTIRDKLYINGYKSVYDYMGEMPPLSKRDTERLNNIIRVSERQKQHLASAISQGNPKKMGANREEERRLMRKKECDEFMVRIQL